MLLLIAKATLILLAAATVTALMKRASAGARHLVWLAAMGALLVLPALAAWSPLRLRFLPETFATRQAPAENAVVSARDGAVARSGVLLPVEQSIATDATEPARSPAVDNGAAIRDVGASLDVTAWLMVVWAAVSLVVVGWLAHGASTVRRIVARARPLESQSWLTPLYEIGDRLGISKPPRLLLSGESKMPFACGFVRPTIVMPADADEWSEDRRRAVLLHELGHVRRRDLFGHMLGHAVCAFYWFHPLAWTAARRMRIESERACDDLALTSGARASEYAEHLLEIVTRVKRHSAPAVAIPMAQRKEFEGRMIAILDPDVHRAGPRRRHALVFATSAAMFVVVVGAAAPLSARVIDDTSPGAIPPVTSETVSKQPLAPAGPTSRQPDAGRSDASTEFDDRARPERGADIRLSPLGGLIDQAVTSATDEVRRLLGGVFAEQGTPQQGERDERALLLSNVLRSDTSARLRRVAAWGLSQHTHVPQALEALATAVRRDASSAVREMAVWALSDADEGDDEAIAALGEAVRRDADASVRETAAWSLGNIGSSESAPALVDALAHSDADVRTAAAWALAQVDLREAPPALIRALRDETIKVRRAAAWALYEIEDPAAVPELEAAMNRETDRGVRMAYIRALAAMGERSASVLARLLESDDNEVREIAIRALAGAGWTPGGWPWPWPRPRPSP